MNSKITLPELVAMLALKSGKSKRLCEDFLKQFFALVAKGLEEGENIRIKGFGSFKMTRVEARKSVNVSTGQEFEIPAHNRISFVASKELAAAVNAPFASFESVELADDVTEQMLDQQPDQKPLETSAELPEAAADPADEDAPVAESVDTTDTAEAAESAEGDLDEVERETEAEEVEEQMELEEAESEFPPVVVEKLVAVEHEPEAERPESVQPEKEQAEKPEAAPVPVAGVSESVACSEGDPEATVVDKVEESRPVAEAHIVDVVAPTDGCRRRRYRFGYGFLAGFGVAVLVGVIIWLAIWCFNLNKQIKESAFEPAMAEVTDIIEEQNATTEDETVPKSEALMQAKVDEPAQAEEVIPTVAPEPEKVAKVKEEKAGDMARTKPSDQPRYDHISKTRFLTTMAKEYYGNYEFWPYIYKANGNLGHPDRIRPGTRIKIPPLSSLGADPSNPNDVSKAKRMGVAIYQSYKTPLSSAPTKTPSRK